VSSHDLAAALDAVAGGAALDTARRAPGGVSGIGIDAVDLERFRALLGRRRNLAGRLFTEAERAYAGTAADPVPRLATRFAAKEAVLKALGVGLGAFQFHEVEVVREGLDAPFLVLHGSAADRAGRAGVSGWHLSLTHTDLVAVAVVVAVGRLGRADPRRTP
jgi:holo-[acyl-carrier protein] synthase